MTVPDALSRAHTQHDPSFSSPDEKDPYFPYVPENTGEIKLPGGGTLQEFLSPTQTVQGVQVVNHVTLPRDSWIGLQSDSEYDADLEIIDSQGRTKHRLIGKNRKCKQATMSTKRPNNTSLQTDEMTDQIQHSGDNSVIVDHDQTGQTDSPIGQLSQESNNSANESSLLESETSQSSFLEDEVKKVELFTKFDFSPEKTKELQRLDSQLHELIKYLESGILSKGQKRARRILLESGDYALIYGLLWHSRVAKSKRTKHLDHYQLVLPDTMVKTVVQLYHDSPMSGHAGITDTLDRVKEHYFFQRMGPIITNYVRSCQDCQKRKTTKYHTKRYK